MSMELVFQYWLILVSFWPIAYQVHRYRQYTVTFFLTTGRILICTLAFLRRFSSVFFPYTIQYTSYGPSPIWPIPVIALPYIYSTSDVIYTRSHLDNHSIMMMRPSGNLIGMFRNSGWMLLMRSQWHGPSFRPSICSLSQVTADTDCLAVGR